MILTFAETHLRSKRGGIKSVHFNRSTEHIELLLPVVISVNQLSFYGAVADMIEELAVGQRAPGNPLHQVNWIKNRFLHNFLLQKCKPMKSDRGICCKNTSKDLKTCQKTRSYPNYAPKQICVSRNWTILLCASVTKRRRKSIFMPRKCGASRSRRNSYRFGHKSLQ